jgi:hypothetical protein
MPNFNVAGVVLVFLFLVGLMVAGSAWIRSIARHVFVRRAAREPLDSTERVNATFSESWRRAQRGRRVARLIFAEVCSVIAIIGLLLIGTPSVMYEPVPNPSGPIAALGLVIGLAWMVRILRANPEPDAAAWRYRDV